MRADWWAIHSFRSTFLQDPQLRDRRAVLEPDPELAVAYGLFSVRQAAAAGYSGADIKRYLRRGRWTRLERGILLGAGRPLRPHDAVVLALLRAGRGAVAGFETAAAIHGWDAFESPLPPRLIVPPNNRYPGGYRTVLRPDETQLSGIVLVTVATRTALDIAGQADYCRAVVALDSALRSGNVRAEDLVRVFGSARGRGVSAARKALAAADPRCGSPAETEARLLFASAGLPAPVSQYRVQFQGGVAYLDFAWEAARLGAEIDGFKYHSAAGAFQHDRVRQNGVQLEDWLILRFTLHDLRVDSDRTVSELWRGLKRRG